MQQGVELIKYRIANLAKDINKNNQLYYQLDAPIISDEEYDQMLVQLQDLYSEHPNLFEAEQVKLLNNVGGQTNDGFIKAQHHSRMYSLNNVFSNEEFIDFVNRTKKILRKESAFNDKLLFVAEPKIDGLALNLIYQDGVLTEAITRGDGFVGELVTKNIVSFIPQKLNLSKAIKFLEVRGEVYMHKQDFLNLNANRQEQGLSLFANARNAAAGSIRNLDPKIAQQRKLAFFAYAIGDCDGISFDRYSQQISFLQEVGFNIQQNAEIVQAHEVAKVCEDIKNIRETLDYQIDGVVIKVDSLEVQKILGHTNKAPRFCIAYKFSAEVGVSILEEINIQVGRTGVLTPVAKIAPVVLAGAKVGKASLHNIKEIRQKQLFIGAKVKVRRAGDVIPEIIGLAERQDFEENNSNRFNMPEICPSCDSSLIKEGDLYYCSGNSDCLEQKIGLLKHFVSKKGANIDGLGDKVVESLVAQGLVNNILDFYKLGKKDFLSLDGFADKSATNLLQAIETAKNIDYAKFIYALGIRGVGEVLAQKLSKQFLSLEDLANTSLEVLLDVEDIGDKIAKNIVDFFQQDKIKILLMELKFLGINLTTDAGERIEIIAGLKSLVDNKTVVITGNFVQFSRDELKNILQAHGAKVVNNLSKKTNMLFVGSKAGSKLDKAAELGLNIIQENQLEQMLKIS